MRKIYFPVIPFLLIILAVTATSSCMQSRQKKDIYQNNLKNDGKETIQLFNGENLNNWVFQLRDQTVDPSTVFTVQNNVINISGNPFGYMRTKDSYSDYTLHLEWRWPAEATNSGIFIHAQLPDTIWLRCIECQLQSGNAGDFVCMSGADMTERSDKSTRVVRKMAASSEKPAGEWNTMEVVCEGNTIEVTINGVLQNKGTGVSESEGHICLQSEGKNIEFRNVYLTKLMK
jgi:hypothetical protein